MHDDTVTRSPRKALDDVASTGTLWGSDVATTGTLSSPREASVAASALDGVRCPRTR